MVCHLKQSTRDTVFEAIVMAKMNYTSPAWWDLHLLMTVAAWRHFTAAARPVRLLQQQYHHCQHVTCDDADKRLFSKIITPLTSSSPFFPLSSHITIICVNAVMITNFQTGPMQ